MPERTETMTLPPAEAAPGHNSAAVGEMIKADPAVVYREPDTVDALLAEIDAEIDRHEADVSSKRGRDLIAARAYAISKTKSALDAAGKDLNEDHRKAILKVDTIRKKIRDGLDALRDKARGPLTKWEEAEKAREARVNDMLRTLNITSRPPAGIPAASIAESIDDLRGMTITAELYGDRTDEIAAMRDRVIIALKTTHNAVKQAEDAQAELAAIKAAQAEKERAEAEAKARADAEAEAARRAEAERQRQADEIKAAEDRAAAAAKAKAEADAIAARELERKAAREKLDAAEAERKAAADALAAKERAEAQAKAKAEAEAAEAARRQADAAHRERVIADAVDAIIRQTSLSDGEARAVINTIAAGQVPAVSIHF